MPKIKIYTTPTCVYCKMTKEFFQKNNIEYEELDVSRNQAVLDEMVKKSHQMGVPVIEIDSEIIVGFDRQEITRALGIQ